MKTLTFICIIILILVFLWTAKQLWKEWKDGRKPTPDDLLFDLKFKIECSIIDLHSELYLIQSFKELRARSDINKEKLQVLYTQFVRRFSVLHEGN